MVHKSKDKELTYRNPKGVGKKGELEEQLELQRPNVTSCFILKCVLVFSVILLPVFSHLS